MERKQLRKPFRKEEKEVSKSILKGLWLWLMSVVLWIKHFILGSNVQTKPISLRGILFDDVH